MEEENVVLGACWIAVVSELFSLQAGWLAQTPKHRAWVGSLRTVTSPCRGTAMDMTAGLGSLDGSKAPLGSHLASWCW